MAEHQRPSPIPEDATKVTDEQAAMQERLDDKDADPAAPGHHQDRHQIADET